MATLLSDNAYGTLGGSMLTTDTTLNFTAGHGARFPAVIAPDVLYCCILNSSNILEEVIITAHTANADSCTVTRATGGTTAKAWNIGDRIEARVSSTSLKAAIAYWAFPAGTRMLFQQTSAPTGWTKDTTAALNDTALRIVTGAVGSGGSNAFSTAAVTATGTIGGSTDGHALTIAELASHTHTERLSSNGETSTLADLGTADAGSGAAFPNVTTYNTLSKGPNFTPTQTGGAGSGTAHNHTLSAATFSGNAISLGLKYNDVIIASKDA